MSHLIRNPPDLPGAVDRLLRQIPAGRVSTYGALAQALGDVIACRWVGHYMLRHDHQPGCPCHRVVRADGELGTFIGGDSRRKKILLLEDGVDVERNRVDLARFGFHDFDSDAPLLELRQAQSSLMDKVALISRGELPTLAAGVDVSYIKPKTGVACYALVDVQSCELVWSTTHHAAVRFPYISSFLAFRELPLLLDLLDKVRAAGRMAEVILVDGSGTLHQRHVGIATQLGVVAGVATVGVTKKLLCGQVDLAGLTTGDSRPIVHEGRVLGAALSSGGTSRKPLFVSPGQLVDVDFATRLVAGLLRDHRLPEPLYWADRLSHEAARVSSHEGKTSVSSGSPAARPQLRIFNG